MNDKQLSSFVLVAQEGSFSKAAERAFLSVPSLKKQMDMLEMELQVRLLERSNRGIQLTENGRAFLVFAQSTLDAWINIQKQLAPQRRKEVICIGYNSDHVRDFIYYRALKTFKDRYPNVKVVLEAVTGFDPLVHDLFLGYCNEMDDQIGKYLLGNMPIHCIINAKSTLATRKFLNVQDLQGEDILIPPAHICDRIKPNIMEQMKNTGVNRVTENKKNGTVYALNSCVSDGISIIVGKEPELPELVCQIPLKGFSYEYNIFYAKRSINKMIVKEYLHSLQEGYQKILSE